MSGIVTVVSAQLQVLTPMFLGGADQADPELRPASLKSALRFWYRAVDPRAVVTYRRGDPREEDLFFGGGGEKARQSPLLIRLYRTKDDYFSWRDVNVDAFNEASGRQRKNGLRYLSYSLHMKPNDKRRALAPGLTATLTVQAERTRLERLDDRARRAWIAALWLLGNLGSLGTRSRRGLGSLAITNWSALARADWMHDAKALPALQCAESPMAWRSGFSEAMQVFGRWFGRRASGSVKLGAYDDAKHSGLIFVHPHLGPNTDYVLLDQGFSRWEQALNDAGRKLQDFRVRRKPDYDDVKRSLQSGRPLRRVPQRAAFGLPLTFRYSSLPEVRAEFVPSRRGGKERRRHASLLRIRLVRLGDRFHPLFLRLSGAMPSEDPPADMVMNQKRQADRREEDLERAQINLLDGFMRWLRGD